MQPQRDGKRADYRYAEYDRNRGLGSPAALANELVSSRTKAVSRCSKMAQVRSSTSRSRNPCVASGPPRSQRAIRHRSTWGSSPSSGTQRHGGLSLAVDGFRRCPCVPRTTTLRCFSRSLRRLTRSRLIPLSLKISRPWVIVGRLVRERGHPRLDRQRIGESSEVRRNLTPPQLVQLLDPHEAGDSSWLCQEFGLTPHAKPI
jgi:hypothetical protein